MAAALTMTIDATEAIGYLGRIPRQLPAKSGNMMWNITQIYASAIKQEANSAFSFPRPYLATTIRPKMIKNNEEYAVSAARYWKAVERGRRPGKMPPPLGIIEDWAKKAGMSSYQLRKSIGEKGTVGRHFVRNGMIKAIPRVDSYIKRESRRLIE